MTVIMVPSEKSLKIKPFSIPLVQCNDVPALRKMRRLIHRQHRGFRSLYRFRVKHHTPRPGMEFHPRTLVIGIGIGDVRRRYNPGLDGQRAVIRIIRCIVGSHDAREIRISYRAIFVHTSRNIGTGQPDKE